jgi:tetratricopeptide (TPR) repeat protein
MNPLDLPSALLAYGTDHFTLGDELRRLRGVQQVGAAEAEIFYATRILEVLSADALRALRLPPAPNAFANLDVLRQLNLLPPTTSSWAHALRRTGNAVRHVQRRVSADDAELAVLFLERWLGWFFSTYRHGPRLPDLPPGSLCLDDRADPELRALMLTLDQGTFQPGSFVPSAAAGRPAGLRSPTLPAVAGELLLERGDPEAARRVARAALERFPDDLRLRQLVGLSYSRQKDLEEARRWLEPLLERYRDEEETIGITAGLFKRLAETRGDDPAWLTRAHRAYLHGWERSRHSNAYLGVNAASTALFLGQPALAQELAGGVRDLLVRRLALLGGTPANASSVLGYWDSVTLAEAHLLLGELAAARASYREAFAREGSPSGKVEVTRHQLARLLRLLRGHGEVDTFLSEEP